MQHVDLAHWLLSQFVRKEFESDYVLIFVCVCALDVSELVDEVALLSDSTSEEHSLSSYTSESFDDNGKTLNAQMAQHTLQSLIFVLLQELFKRKQNQYPVFRI